MLARSSHRAIRSTNFVMACSGSNAILFLFLEEKGRCLSAARPKGVFIIKEFLEEPFSLVHRMSCLCVY
jgi:hypothetical protein